MTILLKSFWVLSFILAYQQVIAQFTLDTRLNGQGSVANHGYRGSTALNNDGSLCVAGSLGDRKAWVFKKTGCTWSNVQELVPTPTAALWYGAGTAMTADGNVIVVCSLETTHIFRRVGMTDTWTEAEVINVPSLEADISDDGNTVILKKTGLNTSTTTEVTMYNYNAGVWTQQGLFNYIGGASTQSVQISGDGNFAVVGVANSGGKLFAYQRTAGVWTETQQVFPVGASPNLGYSIAISNDGNTFAVSDYNVNYAWIYKKIAGVWTFQATTPPNNTVGDANVGAGGVSLNADGTKMVISALSATSGKKSTWVFELINNTWIETQKIILNCTTVTSPGVLLGEGTIISNTGTTIAIGLGNDNTTGSSVWIYATSICASTAPLYVRQDGNDGNDGLNNTAAGAKATIQAAIDAATSGQTIHIVNANGNVYSEDININKDLIIDATGNPTIKSVNVSGIGCTGGRTVTFVGNVGIREVLQADDEAVINANGKVTLLGSSTSQGMLVQNGTGVVIGQLNIQRYLRANTGTAGLGYRFISSPTSDATFAQISELNPVVNPAFNGAAFPGRTVPFPTVYSYNPALAGDPAKTFTTSPFPEFDKGWVSPSALTDAMDVGRGYTVNTTANQVVEITGTVNNGTVNVPIITGNAASLGYNLVGNPYPSPIRWSAVRALSTGVNDAIYQNMATGQYTGSWASFVAGVGTNGATDSIAVMQGFFVIANANGNVVFNNTVRATAYSNPNSFRTEDDQNAVKNNGLLRLALTNSANKTDETVVYFTEKATKDFDAKYDAVKFQLNGGNFSNIYTTDGKNLFSINGLPTLTDDLVVPIIVQSWTNGNQIITMTEKLNFNRSVEVFLKDKAMDKIHDLSKGGYEFAMTSGVLADRFELIFKPQFTQSELNGDILNVYPNPAVETLNISISDDYKGALTLRLIDVAGREIWSEKAEKTGKIYQTSASLEGLASGTYLLEVESSKKMLKKVVKQ
jgi:hypothetical protein